MAQRMLYSADVSSVDNAHERFGREKGLIVLRPSQRSCKWYFTVPEGCYALVTRFGAEISHDDSLVWEPGLYIRPPWVRVSHLVTKQVILYKMPIKEARTKDNVSVEVDLEIMLRIVGGTVEGEKTHAVAKFIHELTPRGLEDQLQAAQQEAVRTLTRSLLHTQVYGLLNLRQSDRKNSTAKDESEKKSSISEIKKGGKRIHPVEEEDGSVGSNSNSVSNPLLPKGPDAWKGRKPSNKILPVEPLVPFKTPSPQSEETKDEHGDKDQKDDDEDDRSENDSLKALLVGSHDAMEEERADKARIRATQAIDEMLMRLNSQFLPQGVEILDVIITNVILPAEIASQMSNKTMIISENAQQMMNQAWEMQRLEFEEEVTTLKQKQDEERQEERQKGNTAISTLKKQIDQLRAEMNRQKETILAEGKVSAEKILAEAKEKVTKERMEQHQILSTLEAESEKQAAVNQAETVLFCERRLAEATLQVAKNQAKASEILNAAEEQTNEMLAAKREFDTKSMQVEVYDSLASNDQVLITDGEGAKVNNMLITEAILASQADGDPGKAKVIAEMAVLRNAQKLLLDDSEKKDGTS